MNQEEDKDHVIDTVNVTRNNMPEKHSKSVTTGEQSIDGWGRHQFLPLAELQPKYLKNEIVYQKGRNFLAACICRNRKVNVE